MQSHYFKAADGLILHAGVWEQASPRLPVLCLSGLSRNHKDFVALAPLLNRTVIALDYRGRGLSQHAPWETYTLAHEQQDILLLLESLNIKQFNLIGTSRGGLHAMLFAAQFPDLIAGSVLNDIGPTVELAGLLRIKGYIGQKGVNGEIDYDAALANTLLPLNAQTQMPEMWPQFAMLAEKPLLTLRGENSDILSQESFTRMNDYNDNTHGYLVPNEGHVPLLEGITAQKICEFMANLS
jgi:pimeloyl-ACP methyl ester carboxylesterase